MSNGGIVSFAQLLSISAAILFHMKFSVGICLGVFGGRVSNSKLLLNKYVIPGRNPRLYSRT